MSQLAQGRPADIGDGIVEFVERARRRQRWQHRHYRWRNECVSIRIAPDADDATRQYR
jgi:hypothetical protein